MRKNPFEKITEKGRGKHKTGGKKRFDEGTTEGWKWERTLDIRNEETSIPKGNRRKKKRGAVLGRVVKKKEAMSTSQKEGGGKNVQDQTTR